MLWSYKQQENSPTSMMLHFSSQDSTGRRSNVSAQTKVLTSKGVPNKKPFVLWTWRPEREREWVKLKVEKYWVKVENVFLIPPQSVSRSQQKYLRKLLVQGSEVVRVLTSPSANVGVKRDAGWIPGSGRSHGGGHGNPLQYSCLKNIMDRRAWQARVLQVSQSWTPLNWFGTHASKAPKRTPPNEAKRRSLS